MTLAAFHIHGSWPSEIDLLKSIDTGKANGSANSFKNLGCISSGPADLDILRLFSNVFALSLVTTMSHIYTIIYC